MPDQPTLSVPDAFAALTQALKAEALRADFTRVTAFLRYVETLEARYAAGQHPHTVRTPAKKGAAAEAPAPAAGFAAGQDIG